MEPAVQTEFRYQPRYCTFLGKHVWAIRTQQADGTWRTVNCLDKDEGCFSVECSFTTDHGQWPYPLERQMTGAPQQPPTP